jgi:hypothetical protein
MNKTQKGQAFTINMKPTGSAMDFTSELNNAQASQFGNT